MRKWPIIASLGLAFMLTHAAAQPAGQTGTTAGSAAAGSAAAGSAATGSAATSDATGSAATGGATAAGSAGDAEQILKLEGDDIPDFDKIRTPDSPAFMLLGVTPTQIERPTTPKEVTAVLSKFVSEGDFVIPKNLAAEIAPYPLLAKKVDATTYLNRSPGTQLWQNLTVSLATASSTRDETDAMGMMITHTDTTLGVGLRTMTTLTGTQEAGCSKVELDGLVAISRSEALSSDAAGAALMRDTMAKEQAARDEAKRKKDAATTDAERAQIDADFKAAIKKIEADFQPASDKIKERLVAAQEKAGDKLASLCIKEVASAHRGWIMDGAVATGIGFPDSVAKQGRYSLGAAWVDVAYEADNASLVVLGRLRDDKTSGDHEWFTDAGGRFILAKDAYAGSVEGIWRHRLSSAATSMSDANTYRLALAADVHLTDGTWLTLSFGRDFAGSEAGSLFTLANLKYGLGDPKVKLKR